MRASLLPVDDSASLPRKPLLAPEVVFERLIQRGDLAALIEKWALRHPRQLDRAMHEGLTPLMLAASMGRVQSANVLARCVGGCTPNPAGMNAFMVAAAEGHVPILEVLHPFFAIDAQADQAGNALAWAVLSGQVQSTQWLLDHPLAPQARQAMIQNAWAWGIAEDDCADPATLHCAQLLAQAASAHQDPYLATHMLWRAIERNSSQGVSCVAPWAQLSVPMPQDSMSVHSPLSAQLCVNGAWLPLSWCLCHAQWAIAEALAPFASEAEVERCLRCAGVPQHLPLFCAARERQALEEILTTEQKQKGKGEKTKEKGERKTKENTRVLSKQKESSRSNSIPSKRILASGAPQNEKKESTEHTARRL